MKALNDSWICTCIIRTAMGLRQRHAPNRVAGFRCDVGRTAAADVQLHHVQDDRETGCRRWKAPFLQKLAAQPLACACFVLVRVPLLLIKALVPPRARRASRAVEYHLKGLWYSTPYTVDDSQQSSLRTSLDSYNTLCDE
eukprot:6212075-Pleurochrysis_carterae.AAC.5